MCWGKVSPTPCVLTLASLPSQNCSVNVNCVNIRCPLRGLDSKASVLLRSRLWNSTFLEVWPLGGCPRAPSAPS